MTKVYTEKTLLKYLYNECDLFETFEVEFALSEDKSLKALFNQFRATKLALDGLNSQDKRRTSIEKIMNYSKSSRAIA